MHHLKLVGTHSASYQRQEVSFGQWLGGFGKKAKAYSGLAMLSPVVTLLHPLLSKYVPYDPEWLLPIACSLQWVIILALIVWFALAGFRSFASPDESSNDARVRDACGFADPDEWAQAKSGAQTALSRYWNFWMFLLVCLLMQYALLILSYQHVMVGHKQVLGLFITLFNNCAAVAFLFCYFTLSQPDTSNTKGRWKGKEKLWALWVATLVALALVEVLCMGLASKNNQLNSFTPEYVSTIFMCISGVGTSVAMGFYISRFNSRELACPAWLLVMLYIYTAIQPLFATFGAGNPWVTVIIANIALLLKILLCLYMKYLFEQGRLLFYLVRIRRLSDPSNNKMKHFASILEN